MWQRKGGGAACFRLLLPVKGSRSSRQLSCLWNCGRGFTPTMRGRVATRDVHIHIERASAVGNILLGATVDTI